MYARGLTSNDRTKASLNLKCLPCVWSCWGFLSEQPQHHPMAVCRRTPETLLVLLNSIMFIYGMLHFIPAFPTPLRFILNKFASLISYRKLNWKFPYHISSWINTFSHSFATYIQHLLYYNVCFLIHIPFIIQRHSMPCHAIPCHTYHSRRFISIGENLIINKEIEELYVCRSIS